MVIAALLVFAVLLVAWALAPAEPAARPMHAVAQEPEALPVAA